MDITNKGIIAVILCVITGISMIGLAITEQAMIAEVIEFMKYYEGYRGSYNETFTPFVYLFIGIPLLFIAGGILKHKRWVRTWGIVFSIASFMAALLSFLSIFFQVGWLLVLLNSIILMYLFSVHNSKMSFLKY